MNRVCTFLLDLQNMNCGAQSLVARDGEPRALRLREFKQGSKYRSKSDGNAAWTSFASQFCKFAFPILSPGLEPFIYQKRCKDSRKRDLFYVELRETAIYCGHLIIDTRIVSRDVWSIFSTILLFGTQTNLPFFAARFAVANMIISKESTRDFTNTNCQ